MQPVLDYFTGLNATALQRFEQLDPLYREWNQRINGVSRRDIDELYKHHVLHSLALTRLVTLRPDAQVLDLGCGGGFPGIPLAIAYPKVHFTLIDGTRKKITVVTEIAQALGLDNVTPIHGRAEEYKAGRGGFDFVVSRAVAALPQLWEWSRPMLRAEGMHGLPNGLIAYKGGTAGAMRKELKGLHPSVYRESFAIRDWFKDEWFWEKYLVYCN